MLDGNAVKAALTTILRHVLSVATGGLTVWLSQKGFDVGGEVALIVGALAAFLANTGWAIGTMLVRKWKLSLALNLDSTATHADLNALAATVPKSTQIFQALTPPTDMSPQEEPPHVNDFASKH